MNGNVTERGREVRRVVGRIALVTALLLTLWAVKGLGRGSRLFLFLPWFAAALGLLQAREGTCVFHAARGTRELSGGASCPVEDPVEAARFRERGLAIVARAAVAAAAATALSLLPR